MGCSSQIDEKPQKDFNNAVKEENKNLKENKEKVNPNSSSNEIILLYYINSDSDSIRLFGDYFVEINKENCKMIINDIKMEISTFFILKGYYINTGKKFLKVKLIIEHNLTDISFMFGECENLYSVEGISDLNTDNVEYMRCVFYKCYSLELLPEKLNWNTSKVKDINFLFGECPKLKSIPDISKWDTSQLDLLEGTFYNCQTIQNIPDISKWDTRNVTSLCQLFSNCKNCPIFLIGI